MTVYRAFAGGTFDWTHCAHLHFLIASRLASVDYLTETLEYDLENDNIHLTVFLSSDKPEDYEDKTTHYSQQERRKNLLSYPYMTRVIDDILFLTGDYEKDMEFRIKHAQDSLHTIYLFGYDQAMKPWAQNLRRELSTKIYPVSFIWIKMYGFLPPTSSLGKFSSSEILNPLVGRYHWEEDVNGYETAKRILEGREEVNIDYYQVLDD